MDETKETTTKTPSEGSTRPTEPTQGAKEGGSPAPGEGRARTRRRKKVSYLTINKITHVDYKDIAVLRRFINEHGKMVPSRQTGNTAKQQRMIARAVRRAREMALLPFVNIDLVDRGERFGGYQRRSYGRGERSYEPRGERSYEGRPQQAPQRAAPTEAPAAEPAQVKEPKQEA